MTTQHASDLHGKPASDDDLSAALDALVRDKLADAATPGFEVEFDPDEAEHAGAFVEDAREEVEILLHPATVRRCPHTAVPVSSAGLPRARLRATAGGRALAWGA